MGRTVMVALILALVILAGAAAYSWVQFQHLPTGVLAYTPIDNCTQGAHTFTFWLQSLLTAVSAMALATALAVLALSTLEKFSSRRAALRQIGGGAFVCIVAWALGSLLAFPVEKRFPLLPLPGCEHRAP